MAWAEVFVAFGLCHLAGDYMLQTEWQAVHKFGGLGRDRNRRGVLNNLPVHVMAATGEGPVIGVDMTNRFEPPQSAESRANGGGRLRIRRRATRSS